MDAPTQLQNPFSSLLDFLKALLEPLGRLTRVQQARLLGIFALVALGALSMTLIRTPTYAFASLVLLVGLVVLMTRSTGGIMGAAVVFAFGLAASWMFPAGEEGTVIKPVPPTPAQIADVRIFGNVRYAPGEAAVAEARVAVHGYGRAVDTNEDGNFELSVPRYVVRNDSLGLLVRKDSSATFRRALRDLPFDLFLPRRTVQPSASAPLVPGAGRTGDGVAKWVQVEQAAPSLMVLRVILDSIRVRQDGTVASSEWRFSVKVNGRDVLRLPSTRYSDASKHGLMLVGGEERVEVTDGEPIRIAVEGTRDRLLGGRKVEGSGVVEPSALLRETPYLWSVPVAASKNLRGGDFTFHFTLVRLGGGPARVKAVARAT